MIFYYAKALKPGNYKVDGGVKWVRQAPQVLKVKYAKDLEKLLSQGCIECDAAGNEVGVKVTAPEPVLPQITLTVEPDIQLPSFEEAKTLVEGLVNEVKEEVKLHQKRGPKPKGSPMTTADFGAMARPGV